MPKVTFLPAGITVDASAGSELLAAAKRAGISVDVPCGGRGICGKCLVKLESGPLDHDNNGILPEDLLAEGFVLLCRSKLLDADVTIETISQFDTEHGKFTEATEDMHLVKRTLLPHAVDLKPIARKLRITVDAPSMGDGLSDLDRLLKSFGKAAGAAAGAVRTIAPAVLRALPDALREADDGDVTVIFSDDDGEAGGYFALLGIAAGETGAGDVGVAVDIGTTTVAVQFVDLATGHVHASKTDYNSQVQCGLDVISRINYARKPERLEELRERVLRTINGLIAELADENGIDPADIYCASVSGNTTMTHLLLGIKPEYIRLEPYTPAVHGLPYFSAAETGIALNPTARVLIAPSVGSYVGGDITSGILCTDFAEAGDEGLHLFIDIGTNGEIVLGGSDFLMGCACSAGPAFEGGGIEHGMRASKGAIERVKVDPATGMPEWSTIGGAPPAGICGSGMISLAAELFLTGWIDAGGRFDRSGKCPAIKVHGKSVRYEITPASANPDGKAIYVTESDIDNIIRAKAAIYSACRVLLMNIGADFGDLETVFIAGGFGRYLDLTYSKSIGLLPDIDPGKFKFIGNASVIGSYMTLLSHRHRALRGELAAKITYIDLSTEPGYMDQYTAALFLPHTERDLFPSVIFPG